MRIYPHPFVYIYVCVCVYIYIYIHTHTLTHMYISIDIHVYTHTRTHTDWKKYTKIFTVNGETTDNFYILHVSLFSKSSTLFMNYF